MWHDVMMSQSPDVASNRMGNIFSLIESCFLRLSKHVRAKDKTIILSGFDNITLAFLIVFTLYYKGTLCMPIFLSLPAGAAQCVSHLNQFIIQNLCQNWKVLHDLSPCWHFITFFHTLLSTKHFRGGETQTAHAFIYVFGCFSFLSHSYLVTRPKRLSLLC